MIVGGQYFPRELIVAAFKYDIGEGATDVDRESICQSRSGGDFYNLG